MGDRANVKIKMAACNGYPAGNIFLYTHWGGTELPGLVKEGLKAGVNRWDDDSYLVRILARGMGMGEDGETGYGIATYPPDNEHKFIVIDCEKQIISLETPDGDESRYFAGDKINGGTSWSFQEYVQIENPQWVNPQDEV